MFPGKGYEDRQLDEPVGKGVDAVRPIRDKIKRRVEVPIADFLPGASISLVE